MRLEDVMTLTAVMDAVGGLPGLCCVAALVMLGMVLNRTVPRVNKDDEEKEEEEGG